MDDPKACSHGAPLYGAGAKCLQCDLIWEEGVVENARKRLAQAEIRIATIKALIAAKSG